MRGIPGEAEVGARGGEAQGALREPLAGGAAQHPAVQLHRVDRRHRERHPQLTLARGREELRLDHRVVGEQRTTGERGRHPLHERAKVDARGEGVVGDAVDGGALADLDPRATEQVLSAGEVDLQPVHGHEADREDVVGARVEAGGLEVQRQQPEVGDVGARAGRRRRQVVAHRPRRRLPGPAGAATLGAESATASGHVSEGVALEKGLLRRAHDLEGVAQVALLEAAQLTRVRRSCPVPPRSESAWLDGEVARSG